MRDPLLIPFALTPSGSYIAASGAQRGDRFYCPGCNQRLSLRAGAVRQHHFAHLPAFGGHGETELHRLAKQRLAQLLMKSAGMANPRFFLYERCERCRRPMQRALLRSQTPESRSTSRRTGLRMLLRWTGPPGWWRCSRYSSRIEPTRNVLRRLECRGSRSPSPIRSTLRPGRCSPRTRRCVAHGVRGGRLSLRLPPPS